MAGKRVYDHDAILADYLAGMSSRDIAAKYGCAGNKGTVLAKERGLSRSSNVVAQVSKTRGPLSLAARESSQRRTMLLQKHKRIAEYAKQHGIAAAAKKYGYTYSGTLLIAERHEWTAARYDQDAILRDYLDGMKLRDIVAKHGCIQVYPSQLAKRAGILRQPRGKRNGIYLHQHKL